MTEDKLLVEAKYGTELRPKQQHFFDSFPAKGRMVVGGVWDLAKLEPKPEDFLRQVFSKPGRATGGVREPDAEYHAGAGRRRTVQYGPPRGQMVVTRAR